MDLTLDGYFWHDKSERVRGTLTWSALSGGDLVLEGALTPNNQLAGEAELLHGRALDGRPIALVNSFVRRFDASTQVVQRWRVNAGFVGIDAPDPAVSTLAISVDGLERFAPMSNLSVTGGASAQDPVTLAWEPRQGAPDLEVAGGRLCLVSGRQVSLGEQRFSLEETAHIELHLDEAIPWTTATTPLRRFVALTEFFANRPMAAQREWSFEHDLLVDHLYQPIVGVAPDDPDKFWLRLHDISGNLPNAFDQWIQLLDDKPELGALLVEEVRFSLRTNPVDRVLRLTRMIELLHRRRHPDAQPEESPDIERHREVIDSAPERLRGWLSDQLGLTRVKLRQRIRDILLDLDGGLDEFVRDPDDFARVATKTRNWHTHYGDRSGIADGEYVTYLAMRLWVVVRATFLLEFGWSPSDAVALVYRDGNTQWVQATPLRQT